MNRRVIDMLIPAFNYDEELKRNRTEEMTKEELNKIIENHKHWLNQDCEGWETMKADLRYADLHQADLGYTNLIGADLRNADLSYAYLRFADLRNADLGYTNLMGANLRNANLSYAYLRFADLRNAYLCDADLHGADLRNADISYVDLTGVKNLPFIPYACPNMGSFIGYKKANQKIIKLEIPEDAHRTSATSRKCRCSKAKVLGIYDYENNLLEDKEVASDIDREFIYRVGEIVEVKDFDEDRWHECSTGIHFFINFEEAVNY